MYKLFPFWISGKPFSTFFQLYVFNFTEACVWTRGRTVAHNAQQRKCNIAISAFARASTYLPYSKIKKSHSQLFYFVAHMVGYHTNVKIKTKDCSFNLNSSRDLDFLSLVYQLSVRTYLHLSELVILHESHMPGYLQLDEDLHTLLMHLR